jgi:AAA+ superfamily predicted ATPase
MTAPTVERLARALRLDSGEPVLLMYGPGTGDQFICTDYQQRDLTGTLWHLLTSADFARVVFSSFNDPLYFLDEESRALSVTGAMAQSRRAPMAQIVGPQGSRVQHAAATTEQAAPRPGTRSILPSFALQTLDAYLRQDTVRTAVVIERAEEYLSLMTPQSQLIDRVGAWVQGRTGVNRNTCIFVFTADTVEKVAEHVAGLQHFSTLAEYIRRQVANQSHGAGGLVSMPGPRELERLLDLARIKYELKVTNWAECRKLADKMDGGPPTLARTWLGRLANLPPGSELSLTRYTADQEGDMPTAQEQLDSLIGLGTVKDHIARLRSYARVQAERAKSGNVAADRSNHMIFSGNPGTGKTTVARIVGQLYQEMGLLRRGHLVEVAPKDLVGEYVGATAIKTSAVIDSALDGVLFLDEAYQLTEKGRGGFIGEALDTILPRLENDRDRLLVIAAGYTGKMIEFVAANPGLRRRFPDQNKIEFPDYGPDELLEILLGFLTKQEHDVDPEMTRFLGRVVAGLYAKRDVDTFGNAGEMRNLAQAIDENWTARVDRLSESIGLQAAISQPLLPEDVPAKYRDLAS